MTEQGNGPVSPETLVFDIRHLNLFYGKHQALKDINMQVKRNEITALIGPSGCGKSTLLKTLNRMNDWVSGCRVEGQILFEGKDIFKEVDPLALRYRVGMVFQQPSPFPKSIFDNVAYGPRVQGITNKAQLADIVEKSLRQAAIWDELKDRLDKSALGLSGGQQQRVLLARALCAANDLLILDEPVTGLDPASMQDLYKTLRYLNAREGMAIIMVTHDMENALREAKHILSFDRRGCFYGTVGEFLSSPAGKRFGGEKR